MLADEETGEMRKQIRKMERFIRGINDDEMLIYLMQLADTKLEWRNRDAK